MARGSPAVHSDVTQVHPTTNRPGPRVLRICKSGGQPSHARAPWHCTVQTPDTNSRVRVGGTRSAPVSMRELAGDCMVAPGASRRESIGDEGRTAEMARRQPRAREGAVSCATIRSCGGLAQGCAWVDSKYASVARPRGHRRQIRADGRTQGSHLLCRTRPSTAPHEAIHRCSIPSARTAVQSLGAHYSSPPEEYTVVCHRAAGLSRQSQCRFLPRGTW